MVKNKYVVKSNQVRDDILKKIGKVGDLDQSLLDEWEFWKLAKKNSNILIYEDKLSFPDIQKLNAMIDMDDDYKNALDEYYKKDIDNK